MGNGFTDPVSMLHYSEFAYQLGLLDGNIKRTMHKLENKCCAAIHEGHLLDAHSVSKHYSVRIVET